MDHLPTEDGGGSHVAHVVKEWYDVVHFTIVRNSALHWTNQWPRVAKQRQKLVWMRLKSFPVPGEGMQLLGSAATNARTSDGRIEKVGHGDTDERLCLPPDHKANIQVDQTQSTVARSP
jgi:hypothetical protein